MRRLVPLAIAGCLLTSLPAAEPLPEDRGAAGLRQTLRRLANPYRVLHITAHPDDEDGGTLTYLSRGLGASVTIASVTRGESGANLITGDFFDELGALRTLEFAEAARYYGVRLRFTSFADFGYSKSLNETLRHWKTDEVLADLVRIVREERPHVILARWRGDPRDGHGQHSAAGLLARQVYEAAADASRFPGLPAWRTLKLYADNRRENDDWTIRVDAGVYDPVLGRTYAELAREGVREHRSQGVGGPIAGPGPAPRYYKLIASEVGLAERESSFFERLNVAAAEPVQKAVRAATDAFRIDDPSACVPLLAEALRLVRAQKAGPDAEYQEALLETAIQQALGARLEVWAEPADASDVLTPGSRFEIAVSLHVPGRQVTPKIEVHTPKGWKVTAGDKTKYTIDVPADAEATPAHWRRDSVWDVAYRYAGDASWGRALPQAPVWVEAVYEVDGTPVRIAADAEARYYDRERIQRSRRLTVGPAVSVEVPATSGLLRKGADSYSFTVRLEGLAKGATEGSLEIEPPAGWSVSPRSRPFRIERAGEERILPFEAKPPSGAQPGVFEFRATASYAGQRSSMSFHRIHYPGLETTYVSHPAVHRLRLMEVDVAPNLRVGYVMGTGDAVPQTIQQLGAQVTLLDAARLAEGDLTLFDVILLGIRAYAARDDLQAHNQRLLDYAAQGGVLIVQYNTPEFDHNFGPYPYRMTNRPEETAEEDAPVRILDPGNAVFRWPNAITGRDFDGWVEQRGSKFLVEWDNRYQPLVETHDDGQAPQRGVWLAARHGKGLYVYCALAWYRQLPEAVPGAVRLFANLISLGSADAPWRQP